MIELDDEDKIQAILMWAETHPFFDTSFVESLDEQLQAGKTLSEAQKDALDVIIDKFDITD